MRGGLDLLPVLEVAKRTGYSREHAYRLCRDGVIPSAKLANGRIVVPVKAFDEWVDGLNRQALGGAQATEAA